MLTADVDHYRCIFTNRCAGPTEIELNYQRYSIGHWIEEGGNDRYRVVETRGFEGLRSYAFSELPLSFDNQSVSKERLLLGRTDPHLIDDEITVIEHVLTLPWIVDKRYVRARDPKQRWPQYVGDEGNLQAAIGDQHYVISGRIGDTGAQKPVAARSAVFEAQVRR